MILVRQSRTKLAIIAALFTSLTAVLAFMTFVSAYLPDLWSYLGITLFAPVALASAMAATSAGLSFSQPATLQAGAEGFVFRNWRQVRQYRWDEIADFIVFSPQSRLRSPGCALKSGRFVSFGRNWERQPEEIVEGLKAALSPSSPAPPPV